MNHLKFLPKITKRDKVSDSRVFYRCIINGELSELFTNKADLVLYVSDYHKSKPISSLNMQKITLQTLIS